MFRTLANKLPRDPDFPQRTAEIILRQRVLDGTLYDVQARRFHEEYAPNGEYVRITDRAPSVRTNLCRIVVEDSAALLFGEGRFPVVDTPDETTRETFAAIVKETHLNLTMIEAAIRGSVGSVVVLMRVLKGRLFYSVMETTFLTPEWDPEAPDTLLRVTEKYKVRGEELAGYDLPPDSDATEFWFQRIFDADSETWFLPWTKEDEQKPSFAPQIDAARSVQHALGFVPMVWIKNLPGGNGIDGACTFASAMETVVQLDYLLSAGDRALMYQAAPRLLIKGEIMQSANTMGPGDALVVDKEGDAKLLETDGTASAAILAYADKLRERALEAMHGNRANSDKMTAAQSGRAMELMHQALIWLADNLRVTYGEGALLSLMRMIVQVRARMPLKLYGAIMPALSTEPLQLRWPPWFPPTQRDKTELAGAISTAKAGGFMSTDTAVKAWAPVSDIEDTDAEIAAIEADKDAAMAREVAQAAQVQVKESSAA